jgi:hypothetical protein
VRLLEKELVRLSIRILGALAQQILLASPRPREACAGVDDDAVGPCAIAKDPCRISKAAL